jgi:hypothetical protein
MAVCAERLRLKNRAVAVRVIREFIVVFFGASERHA